MATTQEEEPPERRRRFLLLLFSILVAFLIATFGSCLVVISQNPASQVNGPAATYGSTAP